MSEYTKRYSRMATRALMLQAFSGKLFDEMSTFKANTKLRILTETDVENEKKRIITIRNSRKKFTEKKLYQTRAARKCSR